MNDLSVKLQQYPQSFLDWLASTEFVSQIGIVAVAIILAYLLAAVVKARLKTPAVISTTGAFGDLAESLRKIRELAFPVLLVVMLAAAMEASRATTEHIGFIQVFLGLGVIFLVHRIINRFIRTKFIIALTNWVALPVALLLVFGWLDNVTAYLDKFSIEVGSIRVSAYALARTLFFGAFLFWLGRISNSTGKRVIRSRPDFDSRTREIVSKLFEICLFVVIALLLLQVMGVNFTTLAVFGGAVGVGLGFGLQQIASNFISGIIILLDRSITIGDYIELEDGRAGVLRDLTMRSATLETFDGKDIMVPNEKFITSSFTNWTHNNAKQRYSLNFSVAYKTDLVAMFDIVRDVIASHPKVLSGDDIPIEERPDAEIESFGDSGINILVEFWMEGIDDGVNRVGGDLLLMIWVALKENDIEIPFPQREVSILPS